MIYIYIYQVRAAFEQLQEQPCAHLMLDRQLRKASCSAQGWLERRTKFASRLGASSVAAYALGLGDRHLENVLLDARDGTLVDVDWGVCFDLGSKLRVPERVPFRLTRCVAAALGPARENCAHFRETGERALRALRVTSVRCDPQQQQQQHEGGGRALLELLELCCRDARVEWRATLGQRHFPRPRHATEGTATVERVDKQRRDAHARRRDERCCALAGAPPNVPQVYIWCDSLVFFFP